MHAPDTQTTGHLYYKINEYTLLHAVINMQLRSIINSWQLCSLLIYSNNSRCGVPTSTVNSFWYYKVLHVCKESIRLNSEISKKQQKSNYTPNETTDNCTSGRHRKLLPKWIVGAEAPTKNDNFMQF